MKLSRGMGERFRFRHLDVRRVSHIWSLVFVHVEKGTLPSRRRGCVASSGGAVWYIV